MKKNTPFTIAKHWNSLGKTGTSLSVAPTPWRPARTAPGWAGFPSCGSPALESRVSSCGHERSHNANYESFLAQGSNPPSPCTDRWFLNHQTPREVLPGEFKPVQSGQGALATVSQGTKARSCHWASKLSLHPTKMRLGLRTWGFCSSKQAGSAVSPVSRQPNQAHVLNDPSARTFTAALCVTAKEGAS